MKNNIRKSFFILSITFYTYQCMGQGNWRQGYVVKENGDTLIGLINYHEDSKSTRLVRFKKIEEDAPQDFTRDDIKLLSVIEGKQELIFKKIITGIDYSQNRLPDLESNPIVKLTTDTVLAQLLVNGKKTLYHYKDPLIGKNHFFVTDDEGSAIELVNKRYFISDNVRTDAVYSEEYKKQLKPLLGDCPKTNEKIIQELKFSDWALTDIIITYNRCKGKPGNGYLYKIEKVKPEWWVSAGWNITSLSIKTDQTKYSMWSLNKSSGFNLGATLNSYVYRTRKNWSVYNQLLFTYYKIDVKDNTTLSQVKKLETVEIKASYLKVFSGIRFQNFNRGNFKPFIQAGIGNGFAIKSSSDAVYKTSYNLNNVYYQDSTLFDFRKYEFSYFAGIGLSYKSYSLEARYEGGNGMSKISDVGTRTKYVYFLVSYKF